MLTWYSLPLSKSTPKHNNGRDEQGTKIKVKKKEHKLIINLTHIYAC